MRDQDTFTNAAQSSIMRFFEYLPQLVGALLLIVIGYLIAKLLESGTKRLLRAVGFDRVLLESSAGRYIKQAMDQPSRLAGSVVFWLIFLGFISLAVAALQIEALTNFIGAIYAYIPNVIAALLIFLVAGAISAGAVTFVGRVMGSTPFAKTVATVVPSLVMSIAVFMILNQLGIAKEIVLITYTALIGAVSLGLALAFGLGGREVAARLLDQAYEAGRRNAAQAKSEVAAASANVQRKADREKRRR